MDVQKDTTAIKAAMDTTFRFRIGDAVSLRTGVIGLEVMAALNGPLPKYERIRGPGVGVIVTRFVEECHAGIQLKYVVSAPAGDGSRATTMLFEYELATVEEEIAALARCAPSTLESDQTKDLTRRLQDLHERLTIYARR